MRQLLVDNYIINTPIEKVLAKLKLSLTNGKLKDIEIPTGSGDNIVVTCPHHAGGHESEPACNIYIGDDEDIPYGFFRCWVCNEQGDFTKFVAECFDSSLEYAKEWLITHFDAQAYNKINLGEDIDFTKAKLKNCRRNYQTMDKSILNKLQPWHPYLAQRKLSREICEYFQVKYDPFYRQIVFPCFDEFGNLIMLPRRSIDTKTFYLDKGVEKPVYCLDYIIKNNIKTVIITEGPFDCLTCYEYGYPAIATLGRLSDYQIDQIIRSGIRVLYLMFDNDSAGAAFAKTLKEKLAYKHSGILVVDTKFPQNRKDINELSREEFYNILQNT